MIKLILLIFYFLFSLNAIATNITGGMDAGGGGTLPTNPAYIFEIIEAAEEARPTLLYWFNGYERSSCRDQNSSICKKLFLGPVSVQQMLKSLRLEVREDRSCYSSQGTEVDGSIYGANCLSAFRIAPKLDKALVQREVLALLAHEVSHFMGTNEEEAVKIQKDMAFDIMKSESNDIINGDIVREKLDEIRQAMPKIISMLKVNKLDTGFEIMDKMRVDFLKFVELTNKINFNYFGYRESEFEDLIYLRLHWAFLYLASIADNNAEYVQEKYKAQFANRDYFLLGDEELYGKEHLYANEKIQKINSTQDLILQLDWLSYQLNLRGAYSYQVAFDVKWFELKGDQTELQFNPWQDYIGRYVIQSGKCTDGTKTEDRKEIKIELLKGEIFFSQINAHSSSSEPIKIGSYNFNSYVNQIGTNQDGVYMIKESLGSWSQRQFFSDSSVEKVSLKINADNTFQLETDYSYFSSKMNTEDTFKKCIYVGNRH